MNETIHSETGQAHALTLRFEKLGRVEHGWMEGAGKAPTSAELAWLSDQFASTLPVGMPLPFVCPTPAGGVFMEWTHGDWTVSAEIPLPERRCELQAINAKTHETFDEDLRLAGAADFAAIYHFVGRFVRPL